MEQCCESGEGAVRAGGRERGRKGVREGGRECEREGEREKGCRERKERRGGGCKKWEREDVSERGRVRRCVAVCCSVVVRSGKGRM